MEKDTFVSLDEEDTVKKPKRQKLHNKDFVKDGLSTQEIRDNIMKIREYIKGNKHKFKDEDQLIQTLQKDYEFFAQRYPILFNMACTSQSFDYESLEYFLNMRDNIINDKISSEDASKKVGQEWFDKFVDVSKLPKK